MNRLRAISEIGMPYHGLAVNGDLSTSDGTKSITTSGGLVGHAQIVRHPAAPGASRNTAQSNIDTARGYEWRDYALLTDSTHGINGGPGLGNLKWLYCDPSGATWVLRVGYTKNGSQIDFEVWIDAIFGRFGRLRTFSPRQIASLSWSPAIPSWVSTSFTAANVVSLIDLTQDNTLAISPDGSDVFVNLFSYDGSGTGLNQDCFIETTPCGLDGDYNYAIALVGVLRVAVTGSGDLDFDGAGISATLTQDLAYEGGLVTNRQSIAGSGTLYSFLTQMGAPVSNDNYPGPPPSPACPDPGNPTRFAMSIDITWSWSAPTSGSYTNRFSYDAILYKSPGGTVERAFVDESVTAYSAAMDNSALQVSLNLSSCPTAYGGYGTDGWFLESCSSTNDCLRGWLNNTTTSKRSVTVSAFGAAPVARSWERVVDTTIWQDGLEGGYQACNGGSFGSFTCAVPNPTTVTNTTVEINGVAATYTDTPYFKHEVRVLSANLAYLACYLSTPTSVGTHNMDEFVWGAAEAGTGTLLWSGSYTSTYRQPASDQTPMPLQRELVWAYQPATGVFTHAPMTFGSAYTGDLYQYV